MVELGALYYQRILNYNLEKHIKKHIINVGYNLEKHNKDA